MFFFSYFEISGIVEPENLVDVYSEMGEYRLVILRSYSDAQARNGESGKTNRLALRIL